MSDLPLDRKSKKATEVALPGKVDVVPQSTKVQVTHENADLVMVHFLSQIHGRLGYIIKLLEEKK